MFTRINHFIIFILTFTCFVINSRSQIDSSHISFAANSLVKSSWSAQFELGTYINSGKFETFLISFKRHLSKNSALRLGFGYDNIATNGTNYLTSNGSNFNFPIVNKTETFSGVFSFLHYFKPGATINVFIGAGPIYKYHYQKYSSYSTSYSNSGAYANVYDNVEKSWSTGVNGVFGAEWFPFNCISFVAEYNANVMFGKTTTSFTSSNYIPNELMNVSQSSNDANSVNISFNIVRLGISVYF